MKRNVFMKVMAAILPVFLLCACGKVNSVAASAAADVKLKDMEGKEVGLSSFKGKVIILDFFATWCPPCRQEIPGFVDLQKRYADKGLVVIGVSLTPASDVKPFAAKMGINYPILIDNDLASQAYGPIRSIPTTFIIDKEFNIVGKHIGYADAGVFESEIKALLDK